MRQLLALWITGVVWFAGAGCGSDALDVASTWQPLSASPLAHTFSNTQVGNTSAVRKSTVSHTTTGFITVSNIAESCSQFSYAAETVYLVDSVENSRTPWDSNDTVYRVTDPELGFVEQQVVEIFMYFSPTARGAAPACNVNVTTSSTTDPVITLNGTGVAAEMATSMADQSFDNRRLNTTSPAQSFTVTNTGDTGYNLTVTSVAAVGNPEDWNIVFDTSTSIAPGTSRNGTAAFAPKAAGAQNTTLTILSSDPVDGSDTFVLTGTGLTATVSASVSSLTIPSGGAGTIVNGTNTNTVTVNNTAITNGTTLTVSNVTFTGAHASDFSLASTAPPLSIGGGGNSVLTVQCRPSATGVRTATMTIDTDADNSPQDPAVSLSCTGVKPDISVSPSPMTFATPIAPGASANQTLTISNAVDATASLSVTALTMGGTNPGDFSASPPPPYTIAAGGFQPVTVTFAPQAIGDRAAILAIASNDVETATTNVTLNGTGQAPEITLAAPAAPAALSFGDVLVSSTSTSQTVTVRNDGNSNLSVTDVSFSGPNAADFTRATGTTTGTITPNSTQSWTITCTPSASGNRTASFDIASNDTTEPTTAVALSCNGIQGVLAVTSHTTPPIDFGSTRINTTGSEVLVTVRNTGTASLTVTSASVTSNYSISRAFAPAPPFALDAGATATLGLTFSPLAVGATNGTLTIANNGVADLTASLTGTGTSALVATSLTPIPLGPIVVGQSSAEQQFTISSTGTNQLTLTSAALTGGDPTQFAIVTQPTYPMGLAAAGGVGASTTFGVRCAPTSAGAKSTTLRIASDADNTPQLDIPVTCTGTKPDITVSPNPVTFGDVTPGSPSQQTVTIANASGGSSSTLTVTALTLSGTNVADFGITTSPTLPFSVTPGTSQNLTLTFTPGGLGSRTANLAVVSNDQETPTTNVPLSGNGFAPELTLTAPSVGSLAFGDVQVSTTSGSQLITVKNDGTAPLTITSVTKIGSHPGDYVLGGLVPPPNLTLAAGDSASWPVACAPTTTGTRTASIRIASDDSSETNTDVALTCTGTQGNLVVSAPATPIAFGPVDVGSQSGIVNVTLTNTGTGDVTINSLASASPSQFTITSNFTLMPPFTIARGATETISMRFTPTAEGSASGTLTVSYDTSTLSVGLSGTGRAAIVGASPAAIPFGDVVVGTTTTTSTVTLTNTGSATLAVSSASLGGTDPTQFAVVSPTFPQNLVAGGNLIVTVRCAPTTVAGKSATLTFDTDADNVPQDPSIGLTCTGVKPDITVAPGSVTFGNVAPGTPSQQTVTVSNANTATTSTLVVTALTLSGANAGDYSITPGTGFSLAPNTSQIITVTFTPSALGSRTASLAIASNDQETPTGTVSLTGNGFAPEVTVTAPAGGSLTFGDQKVGTTSTSQPVTLANDGNATLSITAASLVGTAPGDFTLSALALPQTLAGATAATWSVACAPTTTGGRSATVRFTTNDANEATVDVPVTCNGTQGLLVVQAPATPIQLATTDVGATSAEVTVTIRNSGTAAIQIDGAAVSGPFTISTPLSQTPPFSLGVNATATLGLRMAPTTDGLNTGTLTVDNEASDLVAQLRGTGQAALVAVSSGSLEFANVLVGSTATTRTFQIQNTGSAPLAVSATSFGGAHPGDFVLVSPTFPASVPAAGSVTVTLRCVPTTNGARTATFGVDTDADNAPQDPSVALACNGVKPDISVAPPVLAFAPAAPGTPQQLELLVSNASGAGASILSVSAVSLGGTDAADFEVSPAGAFTLDPGASRVLTITFTPSTFGAKTASVTLTSDDQETASTVVGISGAGSAPEITIAQPVGTTIAFGDVKVGTTATTRDVQIRDDGNEDLEITGVLLVGAQAANFELVGPSTPATITASGGTATWTVACRPTAIGAKAATIEIHSSDADEPTKTLDLTCNGTQATLVLATPAITPVQFAATRVGEMSPEITLIYQNTGTAPLTINNQPISSTGEFVVSTPFASTPPFTIAANATAAIGVRFHPIEGGDLDGMLDVNWDATSLSVPLRGPGRIALASITPVANLDGDVELGAVCVGQPRVVGVEVLNIGTAAFTVSAASVTGTAFSVGTVTPATLTPGIKTTIDVTVDATLGDVTGTLDITTDIPGMNVHTLSLVANGIDTGIGVVPAALAFPNTMPDELSAPQTVTVTNCETTAMSIGQVALQGDDAGDFGIIDGVTPPPAIALDPSESTTWTLEFHPDSEGGSDGVLHISHDLDDVGGGVIDVPLFGWGGEGGPDAGVGPDAMPDPDAAPSPDGGDPGFDQQSYYACSTGAPSSATLLLLLGAILCTLRRRRG